MSSNPAMFATRNLDPLEVRYCYGYARLMASSQLILEGDDESKAMVEEMLPIVLDVLYLAYCTSAIRGRPIVWRVEDDVLKWDSTKSVYGLRHADEGRVHWKALEDLPAWREAAYNPYLEVIQSLPGLLTRLELIEVEDSAMKKLDTDEERAARSVAVSEVLNKSLRNDGFLVHGTSLKITVHHRNSSQVVAGLGALKDHVLASTDYTENRLWNKRSTSGGLAGVDKADRDFEASQIAARLRICYEPVLRLWFDAIGADLTMNWVVHQEDRESVARTELATAQAAKLNIESGILTPEAYTARYSGGEAPSTYPEAPELVDG